MESLHKSLLLLLSFLVLVGFLYLGIFLNTALAMPIPGALTGLLLLFIGLLFVRKVPVPLVRVSQFLLRHLSVFFIPTTLYIIVLKDSFSEHGAIILAVLAISTMSSMLIAALVSKRMPVNPGSD